MQYDVENGDVGPQKRPARTGRSLASTLFLGLLICVVFATGMEYGIRHPEQTPMVLWRNWGSKSTTETNRWTTVRKPARYVEEPGELIGRISNEIARLDQISDRLEQAEHESIHAMALLIQDGNSEKSEAYREQSERRQSIRDRLDRVQKQKMEARRLETDLVNERRKRSSSESDSILDPALRDKAEMYLARERISHDLN